VTSLLGWSDDAVEEVVRVSNLLVALPTGGFWGRYDGAVDTEVKESKLFSLPSSVDFCVSKLLKDEPRLVFWETKGRAVGLKPVNEEF
jgi:hypothetical protein